MAKRVIIYGGELYHHGILGMKWGKKNGPPYPLDPEDHSASEKKAGWKKSLKSFVAKRKRPDRLEANANDSKATKKVNKQRKNGERKGLTDKQKKALAIGATAVVAGLAAYGAYKISEANSGKIANRFLEKQQKGERWITSNSIKYMKDHAYNDILSSYTEYENPYIDALKKLENKYDKNIYNKITKRNSSMLPSYTVKGSISGTLNDAGNRMDFVERKTRNVGSYYFSEPKRSTRYNIPDQEKDRWLARKRK